jgi:hypothetical protein
MSTQQVIDIPLQVAPVAAVLEQGSIGARRQW